MYKIHIVSNPKITSKFGPRFHPLKKAWIIHNGVDLASKSKGTSLYAVADGLIFDYGYDDLNGNWIKVKYTFDNVEFIFSYVHIANSVKLNDYKCKKGEWIAVMGSTGLSTATHLHLTVRRNGIIVDPLLYFEFI